jgi:signal transduction histidine kinase
MGLVAPILNHKKGVETMAENVTIRVLVVDDEGPSTIAGRIEADPGQPRFSAVPVSSVAECLAQLAPEAFDVAVIDMVMPNPEGDDAKAGLYVLEKIKEIYPTTECLILTAYGSRENTVEAMERGAFSYVDKTEEGWRILPIKIRLAAERKRQLAELREAERKTYLSRMADKVVHDMRGPLTAIIGFAKTGLALPEASGAAATEWFEVIHNQGWYLNEMVEEVLDIVRGKPRPLRKQVIDFAGFLTNCETVLQAICRANSADLEVDNCFTDTVEIDPDRMKRVINNLVTNAARAVNQRWKGSGGKVWLTASAEPGWLVLKVKDNMVGFEGERQRCWDATGCSGKNLEWSTT